MDTDWWQFTTHPVVAAVEVAIVMGAVAFGRRVIRTLRALDEHVLPHFRADHPAADTLPARVARVEQSVRSLDGDLRTHMADEARQRGDDVRELKAGLARVHDRIDALADDRRP
jgi:uncharacterized protein YcaQ